MELPADQYTELLGQRYTHIPKDTAEPITIKGVEIPGVVRKRDDEDFATFRPYDIELVRSLVLNEEELKELNKYAGDKELIELIGAVLEDAEKDIKVCRGGHLKIQPYRLQKSITNLIKYCLQKK